MATSLTLASEHFAIPINKAKCPCHPASLSEGATSRFSPRILGATLLQDGQPVSFASRALTPTEQRYAQIEKECLAIVYACQKFNHYILGRNVVTINSDHKPLETIFKKTLITAPKCLQRMLLQLQKYNLLVIYKPGKNVYSRYACKGSAFTTARYT